MIVRIGKAEIAALVESTSGPPAAERDEMAVPSYLHWNPAIRWLMWRRYETIAMLAEIRPDTTVLEFGCGLGLFLPTLAARAGRVTAIDLHPEYAKRLAENRRLPVRFVGDLSQVEDGSIDLIIAADVMEHLDDPAAVARSFCQKLARDGRLIVSGPTETWLYRLGRVAAGFRGKGGYHRFDVYSLVAMIRQSGFSPGRSESVPLPPPFALFKIAEFRR
ncbi:MAG: methyltransferase domain-containing protein [Deltaproteobacteria bacterium]|nr:methyltransferase domain-containing protein [Deltaproteobacteria bacterium]